MTASDADADKLIADPKFDEAIITSVGNNLPDNAKAAITIDKKTKVPISSTRRLSGNVKIKVDYTIKVEEGSEDVVTADSVTAVLNGNTFKETLVTEINKEVTGVTLDKEAIQLDVVKPIVVCISSDSPLTTKCKCGATAECAVDKYCSFENQCRAKVTAMDGVCDSTNFCDPDSLTCVSSQCKKNVGQSCAQNSDCVTGVTCESGKCGTAVGANGDCDDKSICPEKQECSGGKCKKQAGESCSNADDCAANACNNDKCGVEVTVENAVCRDRDRYCASTLTCVEKECKKKTETPKQEDTARRGYLTTAATCLLFFLAMARA